jgi:hypothetical protein
MPLPKSSRARLSPTICFISKLRIGDSQPFLSPLTQLSGPSLCLCWARRRAERIFQLAALGHGRCCRREKSGGPPLLKLSLKVKRNNAQNQSSAFLDAPVSRPQRAEPIKGRRQAPVACRSRAATIEGLEHAVALSRRLAVKAESWTKQYCSAKRRDMDQHLLRKGAENESDHRISYDRLSSSARP